MKFKLAIVTFSMIIPLMMVAISVNAWSGYNYKARIFVGTGAQWAMQKFDMTQEEAEAYMGIYADDLLVMKWSKAWDNARFHGGDWGPTAWCTNEWNGRFPGGSGETWHYKMIWVGLELESSPYWRDGGQAIWGQFEVIMSHGTYPNDGTVLHEWEFPVATPNGLGGPNR